jgi:hypothetical protein
MAFKAISRLGMTTVAILFLLSASSGLSVAALTGTPNGSFAGYFGTPVSSGEVTRLHASWNVSPLTCQTSLPEGQGLDSVVEMRDSISGNVIRVLTTSGCSAGEPTPVYFAVIYINAIGWQKGVPFTINGGDEVSASINFNPATNKTVINFTDVTTGQTVTFAKKVQYTFPNTADAYVKLADIYLPKFSTPIIFSGMTLIINSGTKITFAQLSPTQYYLVGPKGHVLAVTSPLSSTGKAFHVTYVKSS